VHTPGGRRAPALLPSRQHRVRPPPLAPAAAGPASGWRICHVTSRLGIPRRAPQNAQYAPRRPRRARRVSAALDAGSAPACAAWVETPALLPFPVRAPLPYRRALPKPPKRTDVPLSPSLSGLSLSKWRRGWDRAPPPSRSEPPHPGARVRPTNPVDLWASIFGRAQRARSSRCRVSELSGGAGRS